MENHTASIPPVFRLPEELLVLIFNYAIQTSKSNYQHCQHCEPPDYRAFRSLMLLCRLMNRVGRTFLHRRINLAYDPYAPTTPAVKELHRQLCTDPSRGKLYQAMRIRVPGRWSYSPITEFETMFDKPSESQETSATDDDALTIMHTLIDLLPNIHCLRIEGGNYSENTTLMEAITRRMFEHFTRLKHVQLDRLYFTPLSPPTLHQIFMHINAPSFRSLTLKKLILSGNQDCIKPQVRSQFNSRQYT